MTPRKSSVIFTSSLTTLRISFILLLTLLPPSSLNLCSLSAEYDKSDLSSIHPSPSASPPLSYQQGLSRSAPTLTDLPFSLIPSVKSIKVPSGTVKCSCQTVLEDDGFSDVQSEDGKRIEIEIHKPEEGEEGAGEIQEGSINDGDGDLIGSASDSVGNVKKKPIRNSFTLEGEEEFVEESVSSSEDRLFSTEGPPSFLSFLTSLYKNDMLTKINNWGQEEDKKSEVRPEPISSPQESGAYKAFRNSELSGHPLPDESSPDLSKLEQQDHINKYHKDEDETTHAPYFTWDFVYGHNKPAASLGPGKKREFLYLGSIADSFKGPRRRRRRRSLIGPRSSNVRFVYPVGYNPPAKDIEVGSTVENQTLPEPDIQTRSDPTAMDKDELAKRMHESMQRAWDDYGSNGIHNPTRTYVPPPPPPPPGSVTQDSISLAQSQAAEESAVPPHPMHVALPYHQQITPYHVQAHQYYRPPRPFLFIDRIFNPFQPMGSEWDKHVTIYSEGPPRPPEPGMFSRFLANYIDFEVNNHETADLMRRVVFGLFVGFLILGWITLGVVLGVIPLKKWLAVKTVVEKQRDNKDKVFMTRDTNLAELTDKILLALDVDWLKRLEERVMGSGGFAEKLGGGSPNAKKIPIQVFCCILPDEQVNGMVECQVSKSNHNQGGGKKNGGKKSAFKCISDLIYNFQFGPKEDTSGGELDNRVNFKGKANGDFNSGNDTISEI